MTLSVFNPGIVTQVSILAIDPLETYGVRYFGNTLNIILIVVMCGNNDPLSLESWTSILNVQVVTMAIKR